MRSFSVTDILNLRPCSAYGKDRVKQLWGGARAKLSATQIAALDIPDGDRRWALLRLLPDNRSAFSLIVDCLERITVHRPELGGRVSSAVSVARAFIVGRATVEETRKAILDLALDLDLDLALDLALDRALDRALDLALDRDLDLALALDLALDLDLALALDLDLALALDLDLERRWQFERLCAYIDGAVDFASLAEVPRELDNNVASILHEAALEGAEP